MTWHLDIAAIARARAVPIADEIVRRGIKLRRVGIELVGACPVCGDGGKGSRSNRLAVHLRKNVWLCRRCQIVRREGSAVRLYSRNAHGRRLSAIATAARGIKAKSFTIDGEAVVFGPDGLSRFEELRADH